MIIVNGNVLYLFKNEKTWCTKSFGCIKATFKKHYSLKCGKYPPFPLSHIDRSQQDFSQYIIISKNKKNSIFLSEVICKLGKETESSNISYLHNSCLTTVAVIQTDWYIVKCAVIALLKGLVHLGAGCQSLFNSCLWRSCVCMSPHRVFSFVLKWGFVVLFKLSYRMVHWHPWHHKNRLY